MKNVKFVYRDFPLVDIHPDAFRAAEASHCAQDQNKYWAYHDQLFMNQSDLTQAALEGYAKNIGLDMDLFKSCLASEKHKAQVLEDIQDGLALGVKGTPTFFINGVKFEGAVPKVAWDIIFDRLK
jgi:protein-disulfide isomerase